MKSAAPSSIRTLLSLHILFLVLALGAANISYVATAARIAGLEEQLSMVQGIAYRIFLRLEETREKLETYLQGGDPLQLDRYNKAYPELADMAARFAEYPRSDENGRIAVDFRYMVQTFLEQANAAVAAKQDGDLAVMNRRYGEVLATYRLIGRQAERLFGVLEEDRQNFRSAIARIRGRYTLIGFSLLFIAAAASALFLRSVRSLVLKPISTVISAAQGVSEGSYRRVELDGRAGYEFRILAQAFNEMVSVIEGQMRELREAALLARRLHEEEMKGQRMAALVKDAELRSLQSRIHPHFLFNTLNMTCQLAYMENASRTAGLLESLSALFRYSLENMDHSVRLADELRHLRDYIHVQDLRFGGRIRFEVLERTQSADAMLPCLVVQPLVENAVNHGVKTYIRDGLIRISVEDDGGRVAVRVEDNGIGMSEERLREVESGLTESGIPADLPGDPASPMYSGGVALRNVYSRLRLFFGDGLSFAIRSAKGEGTAVEFSFPAGRAAQ